MPHARCSKCQGRRTLRRHPHEYLHRPPPCARCGARMVKDPVRPTDPHYRLDRYRQTLAKLWLAKIHDLKKERVRAVELYITLHDEAPAEWMKEALLRYTREPFTKKQLKFLYPDWKNFDAPF